MNWPMLLFTWTIACPLSFAAVFGVRRWALQKNILDIPNERSCHTQATPRGAGLAIASVTLALFARSLPFSPDLPLTLCVTYMAASGLLAFIGWTDDRQALSVTARLGIQLAATVCMVLVSGVILRIALPLFGIVTLGSLLASIITTLWIAGFTNLFNFMDGIDGLAGTQAVIAGTSWVLIFLAEHQQSLAYLAGLIAAASLGFLFLNLPPARIFMGDVGSMFLGFTLAVLPVLGYHQTQNPRLLLTGILFVAPFVFDAAFTILRRALRHENIFRAHRSHLYQRLVQCGLSHAQVTGLYTGLVLISALAGIVYYSNPEDGGVISLLVVAAMFLGLTIFVTISERQTRTSLRQTSG
ncbi:MAG: glycosyltransferase family 4 protein [Aggregatilineales bacterium]